ncbi:MAG TPA: Hsp20/alpha crystallin family protein [Longimicrobium sp.]|nr:Hsp20/alpha crystallin family protein [Longimicrobium sp.]
MAMYPGRYQDPFDLLNTVFGGGGGRPSGGGSSVMRAPETDVVETQNEIRVTAELPGFQRDAIDVDVENNVLTIRGEKREERTEGEQGRFHLAERRYGSFTRSFVLPRDVNPDGIQATYEDGILTVTIPKSERAKRRRIDIAGGGTGGGTQVHTGGSTGSTGAGPSNSGVGGGTTGASTGGYGSTGGAGSSGGGVGGTSTGGGIGGSGTSTGGGIGGSGTGGGGIGGSGGGGMGGHGGMHG